jgi:cytochrome P450
MPHWAGLVEMDPPEFTPLRKALVPWFSRKAATDRSEITRTITDYVLDQIIEAVSATSPRTSRCRSRRY